MTTSQLLSKVRVLRRDKISIKDCQAAPASLAPAGDQAVDSEAENALGAAQHLSTLLRESQRAAKTGSNEGSEMAQGKSLAGAKQFPRKEHHHKQLL